MQKTYWTFFGVLLLGIAISILLILLITILFLKRMLRKNFFIGYTIVLLFVVFLCIYFFVPCVKDYPIVIKGAYLEDDARVVSFTYVRDHPDGNGQTQYSKPKFYIESKDVYIILIANDVEIGKEYRIRYYPNTGICEVVYCISDGK